jgi:Cu+-exporting ATPase
MREAVPPPIPPRGILHGMEIDPVCGMSVAPSTAAGAWPHGGTTYYFCSVGCLERFKADPEGVLATRAADRSMEEPSTEQDPWG